MNSYSLTKQWFAFCTSKKECTPVHTALYLWLVEQNNLSGWRSSFPANTLLAMQTLHIRSAKTYRKVFDKLVEWSMVQVIHKAKNQHDCTRIALVDFTRADENAGVNTTRTETFGQVNNTKAEIKNTRATENAGVIFTAASGLTYSKTNINIKPVIKQERENTRTHEEKNQKKFPFYFSEKEEKKKSCGKKRKEEFTVREASFKTTVFALSDYYSPEILQAFFDYWSEPDAQQNMRFELEPTWELSRRLRKWLKREQEIINKTQMYGQPAKFQAKVNGYAAEKLDYTIPL